MTRSDNEIPVRRRGGGIPWWAWLIGLALLGLLAYTLLSNMGNRNSQGGGTTNSPAATQATPPGASGAGTSPDASAGTDASGSPASSWLGTDALTVVLPAHTTAA